MGFPAFLGRAVIRPAWWWFAEVVPVLASAISASLSHASPQVQEWLKRNIAVLSWEAWLIVALALAVLLILIGAYRVLREHEIEVDGNLAKYRSDSEERLAQIRRLTEMRVRQEPSIALTAFVREYAKHSACYILVENTGNGPIACRAQATVIRADDAPLRHKPTPYLAKWTDHPATQAEMHLYAPGDTALLHMAECGTTPFFHWGTKRFRWGWAPQMVFPMANKAHPAFMEPIPQQLASMSPTELAKRVKAKGWPTYHSTWHWETRGAPCFYVSVRVSFWSLVDRTLVDVLPTEYALHIGPRIPLIRVSEVSDGVTTHDEPESRSD